MSALSKSVDLGPMSLPLGENPVMDGLENSAVFQRDVLKLNRLLKAGMPNHDSNSNTQAQSLSQPLGLPGCQPKEFEAITTLVEYMDKLALTSQVAGRREARLTLRGTLLAEAKLTAFEEAGRLIFEIRVCDEASFSWLVTKLSWLVRYVGESLKRPLRVIVYSAVQKEKTPVSIDWPEEATT
jgi:hypothetical protein